MDYQPRAVFMGKNTGASARSRSWLVVDGACPAKAINTGSYIFRDCEPFEIVDAVGFIFNDLKVTADCVLDFIFVHMATAVTKPINRVFINHIQCLLEFVVVYCGFICLYEFLRRYVCAFND